MTSLGHADMNIGIRSSYTPALDLGIPTWTMLLGHVTRGSVFIQSALNSADHENHLYILKAKISELGRWLWR